MNKHIIVNTFTLVLTLAVVLVVGKTEGTTELDRSGSVATISSKTESHNDIDEQILIRDIGVSVKPVGGVVIQPEVNEGDMILGQELLVGQQLEKRRLSPLMVSLARVQEALKTLEQIAAGTEQIVIALEAKAAVE